MNITVYCGSKTGNDPEFSKVAIELGEWIGKDGHSLVYGGSDVGLMGIVANTAMENGARAIGVFPNSLAGREDPHPSLSEMIIVDSIDDRKEKNDGTGRCIHCASGRSGNPGRDLTGDFSCQSRTAFR